VFRSYTSRLAALYTVLFAVAVVALGALTLFSTRAALQKQFDDRIVTESQALAREYQIEGLNGVVQAVAERDRTPGALDYGLDGPDGEALAGRLAGAKRATGWGVMTMPNDGEDVDAVRILTTDLPGGYRLYVGDDIDRTEALDGAIIRGFASAFLGVLILGAVVGFGLSRGIRRRLEAITGTAEAIIDGDLSRRVAVRGDHDDLDRLSLTFNRMLDRIAALVENLRQVSDDVAHDLRTPLTRLRQKLEASLSPGAAGREAVLESAMADLDAILATFAALLRIAQIEGGARRSAFLPVDLTSIARTVVEAYAPSAEEGGRTLELSAPAAVSVDGDAELLTQMLANLIENGLRHTPPGSTTTVAVAREGAPILRVTDNGPGVPPEEFDKVLDRFYRLERSRSTPGAGLGLALCAAVVRLHQATLTLADAKPGLTVSIVFPEA